MVRRMAGKCPVCGLKTKEALCPRCGTILLPGQAICPKCGKIFTGKVALCDACGSDLGDELDAPEEQAVRGLGPEAEQSFIEKRLAEVQGSLAPLAEDPDFKSMPATVRKEILDEIGTMLQAPTLPTDAEFGAQIEAWRERGFDVDPVLVLLAQHPNNFRERAVRLIRSQIRKKMEGGTFKCPLCEVYLEPAAGACGNCGAKFA